MLMLLGWFGGVLVGVLVGTGWVTCGLELGRPFAVWVVRRLATGRLLAVTGYIGVVF